MIDSNHLVEVDHGESGDPAQRDGWSQVASVIHTAMENSAEVVFRVDADLHEPLIIDMKERAFHWTTPLSEFPVNAQHFSLETHKSGDAAAVSEAPGNDLDSLLWVVGLNAFGGATAPWLLEGERYRLSQWPNLTRHMHNMHQMHMLAILGNAYFTADELATLAHEPAAEARRLINALSLMGLLKASAHLPAAVVRSTKASKNKSVFSRLLKRLGR